MKIIGYPLWYGKQRHSFEAVVTPYEPQSGPLMRYPRGLRGLRSARWQPRRGVSESALVKVILGVHAGTASFKQGWLSKG
jgi:hypothetical protein